MAGLAAVIIFWVTTLFWTISSDVSEERAASIIQDKWICFRWLLQWLAWGNLSIIYEVEMALATQSYVGCFPSLSIPITSLHLSPI